MKSQCAKYEEHYGAARVALSKGGPGEIVSKIKIGVSKLRKTIKTPSLRIKMRHIENVEVVLGGDLEWAKF